MLPLRVVIAEHDNQVRRCMRRLLNQQPDIDVVGEVCGGRELLDAVQALRPDRVLLDIQTTDLGGLEIIRRIKEIDPAVCVVVLSVYADQLTEALRAGAGHYLLKACPMEDLLRALRHPCCERPRLSSMMSAQRV